MNKKSHGLKLLDDATIENLNLEKLNIDPSPDVEGRVWYNTVDKLIKYTKKDESNNIIVSTLSGGTTGSTDGETVYIKDPVNVVLTQIDNDNLSEFNAIQDGVDLNISDRVLFTNAANSVNNGIYKITSKGQPIQQSSYNMVIPATGSDKDDIIITTKDISGTDIYLNITEHANGTTATISEVDNIVTLSLEKSTQSNTYIIINSYTGRLAGSGGSIRLTLKSSIYKHVNIKFGQDYSNFYSSYINSSILYGTCNINIDLKQEYTKTNQQLVDYINADTKINQHILASVESSPTLIFDGDNNSSFFINSIIKRNETYTTTASQVLSLLNSTTKLEAKMNNNLTIIPRWVSVFDSNNWSVDQGNFDNVKYTSTSTNLAIYLKSYSSVYWKTYNPLDTKNWFAPTKMKITFTGSCSYCYLMSDYNQYNNKYNAGKTLQTITSPISNQEIILTYPNSYIINSDDYTRVWLKFISPSNNIQITNIQFYIGDDYKINSNKILSQIDEPLWTSIFSPQDYYCEESTDSWDGTKFLSTQNNIIRLNIYKTGSIFKYGYYLLYKKLKIYYNYIESGTVTLKIIYYVADQGEDEYIISGYISGTEIILSDYPNININYIVGFSLQSTKLPIAITDIQYYFDKLEYEIGHWDETYENWISDGFLRYYVPIGKSSKAEITYVAAIRTDDAKNIVLNSDLFSGVLIFCKSGNIYNNSMWQVISDDIIIGTSNINFSKVLPITTGIGLTNNNGQFYIKQNGSTLTVNSDGIKVSDGLIKTKIIELLDCPTEYNKPGTLLTINSNKDFYGNGMGFVFSYTPAFIFTSSTAANIYTITHNLNSFDLLVSVWVWNGSFYSGSVTDVTAINLLSLNSMNVLLPTISNIKVIITKAEHRCV